MGNTSSRIVVVTTELGETTGCPGCVSATVSPKRGRRFSGSTSSPSDRSSTCFVSTRPTRSTGFVSVSAVSAAGVTTGAARATRSVVGSSPTAIVGSSRNSIIFSLPPTTTGVAARAAATRSAKDCLSLSQFGFFFAGGVAIGACASLFCNASAPAGATSRVFTVASATSELISAKDDDVSLEEIEDTVSSETVVSEDKTVPASVPAVVPASCSRVVSSARLESLFVDSAPTNPLAGSVTKPFVVLGSLGRTVARFFQSIATAVSSSIPANLETPVFLARLLAFSGSFGDLLEAGEGDLGLGSALALAVAVAVASASASALALAIASASAFASALASASALGLALASDSA
mmetsp:Transcript_8071/g.30256  ORF Transcript_8071/g.30256 Transcript_8071/m.30256 type:complete len:350 (-) Transcript_8071:258-1307(-)